LITVVKSRISLLRSDYNDRTRNGIRHRIKSRSGNPPIFWPRKTGHARKQQERRIPFWRTSCDQDIINERNKSRQINRRQSNSEAAENCRELKLLMRRTFSIRQTSKPKHGTPTGMFKTATLSYTVQSCITVHRSKLSSRIMWLGLFALLLVFFFLICSVLILSYRYVLCLVA